MEGELDNVVDIKEFMRTDLSKVADHSMFPWVPLSENKQFKPLWILPGDKGFVELLRMDAGQEMPLHRHTGEVHVINVSGHRKLESGCVVGPGDYVFEPSGNIDRWKVVGDEHLKLLIIAMGAVEYLGNDGTVKSRFTASDLRRCYLEYCEENNLVAQALS